MKIKIETSGGFAGISSSSEMDAAKLPPLLQKILREVLDEKKSSIMRGSKLPKGAADHLNYKIIIKDGANETVLDFNQYSVDDKLKSLIAYMEKNS